ncbi:MAG: tRNA (adenosine(37)-N6)-threonylcarbamoyltransferase complex ATPase subunit type 1 TsaE [Spirochaetes bacterium RBG_16_49_21]|nr:MAG: tRNA (adenosine(37)-N6)-threonylcarbamoyltransferase complex ATPase subunit type 1 TsaE [Spirochaetes bacterium RBG_16_49_21]
MEKKYISHSEKDTLSLGRELGEKAGPGTVFALFGELGSGKTIIAKGIARGLGVTDEVTSASFTLLEIYSGRIPLYHFDLYRIKTRAELDLLFFEEYWDDGGVSIIEWADRAQGRLPDEFITIRIDYRTETERTITIEYPGD